MKLKNFVIFDLAKVSLAKVCLVKITVEFRADEAGVWATNNDPTYEITFILHKRMKTT